MKQKKSHGLDSNQRPGYSWAVALPTELPWDTDQTQPVKLVLFQLFVLSTVAHATNIRPVEALRSQHKCRLNHMLYNVGV